MGQSGANDDGVLRLEEAEALITEIDRLHAEVTRLEARLGQLNRLAYRDPLVELPNRRSFVTRLQGLISHVERSGNPAAMLFIDVDGLKAINDAFGHKTGDEALVEVAQMLVACVRKADRVARIGGDEFGVLLEDAAELDAWQLGLRIVETVMGSQFCVDGNCLPLSVAVGVGVIKPGDDPQSVMDRADKEMYRVKAA